MNSMSNPAPRHVHPLRNAAVAVAVIASAALSQAPVSTAAASAPVKSSAPTSAALSARAAARSRATARPHAATTFGRSTSATPRATLAPRTPTHAAAVPLSGAGSTWSSVGPTPQVNEQNLGSSRSNSLSPSGRVTALAVDPTNSAVVYAGEAGGGVWKSTNSGTAWAPLTDGQASMAIGAIAIDPSNSLTVYAATGEDNGSGDAQYGNGILKSLDGGTTWTLVDGGFLGQLHIGGIAVDRTTATAGTQHVFAATDVGLFESTNGGVNWVQNASLLTATGPSSNGSPSGGVFQIIQDPTTSGKWWASVADFGASEWGSIAQSTDGGVTWANNHTVGLSGNKMQRIGLGVGTGGASGVAYAAPADLNGDLYNNQIQKTTDGGASWSAITVPAPTGGTNYFDFGGAQGWYDNVVAVDPTNNNHVLFGGVDMLNTTDGGATIGNFHYVGNVYNGGFIHPDFHAVAFTGAADHAYVGNDGGVWSTANLGGSASVTDWANLNATLTTITYYAGTALDSQTLLGGAQDNGTSGHLSGAQALPAFQSNLGGDGGYTAITPNAQTVYGESQFGKIYEGSPTLSGSPPEMGSTTAASPCDFSVAKTGACLDNVSFVMPYVLDRLNPSRLVAGTSRVWESNSGGVPAGSGWHVISPDLTYGTICSGCDFISALTIVPGTGTIFTGSHFGKVFMTTNDGGSWTDITGSGIPDPTTVSNLSFPRDAIGDIQYNPANPNELWIAYGGVDFSSPRGRVFHTTNAAVGPTVWTDISGSGGGALPADPARSLYVDPTTPGTVYVGTWHGVYTCATCWAGSPTGASWSLLGSGLPQVEVSQMTPTSDGKVLAWTFGRGVWSIARGVWSLAPDIQQATSSSQYTLTGSDGTTWQTMDASRLSVTTTAGSNGTAVLGANADLWTSSTGFNQDIAIFVNDNGSGNQLVGWKESGGLGGTFSPNAAYLLATWPLVNTHSYVFTIRWKSNKPEGGAVIWAGAGPISSAFSPTRLTVQTLASGAVVDKATPLADQPALLGSDGVNWQPIDDTNLSYATGVEGSAQTAVVEANADLFTDTPCYIHDIGIFASDNNGTTTGPDTLLGWKESGGFAGIFSPNAAFLQTTLDLLAGHTYIIHLQWKTNKPAPTTSTIYAGAGNNPYSPTRLTVIPLASTDPALSFITTQPTLTGSDGVTWQTLGGGLATSVTPASNGIAIVGGNADLWTDTAGNNQDIGIFVTDNGGAAQLIAWKESGGFAGTFSPNAAFVQDKFPVLSGHTYVFTLRWKTNRSDPSTIYAGAGSNPYSPTSLAVSLR